MRVFGFDPADHRQQYAEQGWVHIEQGIAPEFLEVLQDFARRSFGDHVVTGRAIGGTKEQALYEFPEGVDFPGELFDVIASVAGLQRESMTLSERHIKAYDHDAPERPRAHKDRLSSQVSVGLSIDIPAESTLVLFPDADRRPNMFNVSAALLASLAPEEQPDVVLDGAREIVVDDKPGDVVIFPGSSMWHLRRDGARAVNLYLKFNDFESDPLGEDPATPQRREATEAALREGDVADRVPVPARQLDTITRQYTRDGWNEMIQASVWDRDPVTLSVAEADLLHALDGRRSVRELAGNGAGEGVQEGVRRLAERGVLDLI
jgi:hypothetical protein